jgi:hypothetical protein
LTSSTPIPLKNSEQSLPPKEQNLIHPISALLLVLIDSLWGLEDWNVLSWPVSIPLSFLSVAIPTYFIQRFLKKDPVGKSATVALTLGVLAGVPFPIAGTAVGAIALGLAGLRSLK